MAFTGVWKRTGTENGLAILKHIGMPDEFIEKVKGLEAVLDIKQNGDTFEELHRVGTKENKTIMTLGKECELKQWNDAMVKCVPVSGGANKINTEFDFNGVNYKATREVVGDQLIDSIDLDNGKVVGKFIYTKS